ncbi:MAG: hypothetical protein ACRDI2_09720 [Chloroflexota bacterium]
MGDLRAAGAYGGPGEAVAGAGAVGAGIDVAAELERIRSNLLALAAVLEAVRARYNAHTHNGAVAAPPLAEQAQTGYLAH